MVVAEPGPAFVGVVSVVAAVVTGRGTMPVVKGMAPVELAPLNADSGVAAAGLGVANGFLGLRTLFFGGVFEILC